MSKRKIRQGHRSVRGYFPSLKNGRQMAFESTFERDYFYLLEFDSDVLGYEEQPFKIEIEWNGESWRYTPDVLVECSTRTNPLIVEIKASVAEFPEEKRKAMDRWCSNNGFEFDVIDAISIRTPNLDRAKFLYPYLRTCSPPEKVEVILEMFSNSVSIPIKELIQSGSCQLADVYSLIANGTFDCAGIPSSNSFVSVVKL